MFIQLVYYKHSVLPDLDGSIFSASITFIPGGLGSAPFHLRP